MSVKRTVSILACMVAFGVLVISFNGSPVHAKSKFSMTQQDKIVAFDPGTGIGAMTGVASGSITGVTLVNFKWAITSFPNFTFDDRVGITDTDGDQIIFRHTGTGRFIVPALSDPTLGGNPGAAPFQVFGNGLGGPLTGTDEVIASTGKYASLFGHIFQASSVVYNPSSPPTPPGTPGSSLTEVSE